MSTPRRNSYTVSFKVFMVEWQRKNEASIHRTAKHFSINRKLVREWCQKYSLLKRQTSGAPGKRRCHCWGKPLSVELDQKVCEFLEEERTGGRPVSNQLLKTKAIQIAGGLNIAGFRASCGWLRRWKQQYNVGVRAGMNNAQKIPADYADLLYSFRKSVITIRKAENIGPADIVNMDHTMCRFNMPPSHTNNKRGERTIRIKTTCAEKKGFTVALAATTSGKKVPAVIVFKECGESLVVGVWWSLCILPNVRMRSSTNGWMTAEEYQQWLVHIFGKDRVSTPFVDHR